MGAADFLGEGGALARALDGFEHRRGQVEMAERVEATLGGGGALLVEAGTGIGKSFAYLLPALLCGKRVVVSTATRNLQDQLFEKDLPQLQRILGSRVPTARMKGRENYLCRRRWAEFRASPDLGMRRRKADLTRIARWAAKTRTGDRDEIGGLTGGLDYWRGISAVSENCTGQQCADYDDCHLMTLRQQARKSRIVVVNHHLLVADLVVRQRFDFGVVLPDYDLLIVDEAHRLEGAATQSLSTTVSSSAAERLATDLGRFCRRMEEKAPPAASRLKRPFGALFEALAPDSDGPRDHRTLEPEGLPDSVRRDAGAAEEELRALDEEYSAVLDRLRERASADGRSAEELPHGAEHLRRRIAELAIDLHAVLEPCDNTVFWSAWRQDGERGRERKRTVLLNASPIHAGERLGSELFDPLDAFVLTSATLSVAGGFDFAADALGVRPDGDARYPSPFDFEEQTRLFVPEGAAFDPKRNRDGWPGAVSAMILDLVRASRGRALLLFTSWNNLNAVGERLDAASPYPVLRQESRGGHATLLDRFRNTPGAVLLGVQSFWEGVDVPGEALTLLVIDKLPFPPPNDPLHSARASRAEAVSGSGFSGYHLPMTALALKQGLGRLIRSRRDVGLAAVLDSRLATSRYGAAIVESLPPYRLVHDPAEAVRFLESLP